ncbi:MAG: cation:proton antiporter [Deferribacterota bacterium]|nr:cation:proton antiporter [Deferribacterota bacterium]
MILTPNDIILFLLCIAILLFFAKLFAEIAKKCGIVSVFGEILAGIILGPTVLGYIFPSANEILFPLEGNRRLILDVFSNLSIVMFLLFAGIESDLDAIKKQGPFSYKISAVSIFLPFIVIFAIVYYTPNIFGKPDYLDTNTYALFIATALSISALPVIAKILMDINYYRSDLGATVIPVAIINDIVGWLLFAFVISLTGTSNHVHFSFTTTIIITIVFTLFMLIYFRKFIHAIFPYIQAHFSWPDSIITFCLCVTFFSASFTEYLGIHALFGAFIAGLALGDTYHFKEKARYTIEHFVNSFFSPIFFGSIGLHINFITNFNIKLFLIFFLVGTILKVSASFIGAKLARLNNKESWALGFAMNTRGAMEIIIAIIAADLDIINSVVCVALIGDAIATSLISGPIIKKILSIKMPLRFYDYIDPKSFIYNPEYTDKFELLAILSDKLSINNNLDKEIIKKEVIKRENIMPTGLSAGIAIPHARIEGLQKPLIAVAVCPRGIDFQAPDYNLSHIVFLILSGPNHDLLQLKIIADVAKTFKKLDITKSKLPKSYTEFIAFIKSENI